MNGAISFRPLQRADFALFERWLQRPHVHRGWREVLDIAGLESRYGKHIDGEGATHLFIIQHDGRPIGFIQWYRWADYPEHAKQLDAGAESAGIDFFIGEEELVGRGIGPFAIRQFIAEYVFIHMEIDVIFADPEAENRRSIRTFEKLGFTVAKTTELEGEAVRRSVVCLSRAAFSPIQLRMRGNEIRTDRLIGVPLCADDLRALCVMHNDPEVMETLGGIRTEDQTKVWLRENLEHWNIHGFGLWVFRLTDGRFAGRCGLRQVSLESGIETELGYALIRELWGRGLATEMASAVVGAEFRLFGLSNLISLIGETNTRSRKVAERLGFEYERSAIWKSFPTMLYRLYRSKWSNLPNS